MVVGACTLQSTEPASTPRTLLQWLRSPASLSDVSERQRRSVRSSGSHRADGVPRWGLLWCRLRQSSRSKSPQTRPVVGFHPERTHFGVFFGLASAYSQKDV